jgi:hypothetical protein
MSAHKWKFHVKGIYRKCGAPVSRCEAIIESGDRDDGSPFRLEGVGPPARADLTGGFGSWYITQGADTRIAKPDSVSVYVRVGKGVWVPIVVSVAENSTRVLSHSEMELDLGEVDLPKGMIPYERDA